MTTAERIIHLRKKKGYSTNKLSQLAEIGQATLREIEIGEKSPNIITLEKICNALQISLSDFFAEDDIVDTRQNDDEIDNLPDHVKKELDLAREFILYKYGIKKASADK
ncbi:helix-turn-helix domain-containing protein [Pelosinus baikalensis]|uniref:Helix-turn-helix domain-containing protein n=1 Tax=Pelosinus baikalensis TaxID=2892015 RepID=A0ABS8HLU8_9FIRM|nr:helix-turn-helix transcriptional regulator [Pelosinus baikalensis]MCC5464119.1 helix-turn-helix domain-containing protein [Pelosinus baikalensis]